MRSVSLFLAIMVFALSPAFAGDEEVTISVLVGGFNPNGSSSTGTYGVARTQNLIQRVAELLHVPDGFEHPEAANQIVQVEYYGKTPPEYYTAKDIAQVKAVGKGTPRYALIAAKFIKWRMETTGAKYVNLSGGSYGGLISRYMIEQNLEGLAASGKIKRWLTLEGVVAGAYPANLSTDPDIRDFVIDVLGLDISDPLTMHYDWVNKHINNPRYETKCRYFKNILVGNHVSSSDDLNGQLLTMVTNVPNDGVLLAEDTILRDMPPECRFHDRMPLRAITDTTHLSAKKDPSFLLNIVSFARGNKRVTIRLVQGCARNFDEDDFLFGNGEIVFQGKVFSPYAAKEWGIVKEMAVVDRKHHTAPVVKFEHKQSKGLESTIFDWMVNPEEKSLRLELWAEEVDWDDMYKIEEDFLKPYEDLGSVVLDIPVDKIGTKTYTVKSDKWDLLVEVEIYNYSGE